MNRGLPSQDLQYVLQAGGWRGGGVAVVHTPGSGPVVVKSARPQRGAGLYWLVNALAWLLRLPFLKTAPQTGGSAGQAIEVARLRALHAAGLRVPQVLHEGEGFFVMQWLGGTHLAHLLDQAHPQAAALWQAAGDELLRVHAAGQCLSHAVARNIVIDDGAQPPRLGGLIDFEDDPARVMTLAQAQVRDWLEFLLSSLWKLPLPAPQVQATLARWLAAESAAVQTGFARACQRLAWLRMLPSSRRWGRDTVALQAAAAAAHQFIHTSAAAAAP